MNNIELTPGQLRTLQLRQLDMLRFFRDFCEKNQITFYLFGGGLIGALRHGGFIPWDDDVDVILKRPDYERLCALWKEQNPSERFRLLRTDGEVFTGNIFATLTDTKYRMVKANQVAYDIPRGLVLDIFPLDACPNGSFARRMQMLWAMLYSLFQAQIVPENHGGVLGFGSRVLLAVFRGKRVREKIWRLAERKMTKYRFEDCDCLTELCAGPHWMKLKFPKRIYDGTATVTFEGIDLPCMAGYEEYLQMVFGDYMQLPPEEERRPHHEIVELEL